MDWKTRSQTKALCRKGKFTQRWLVELDLIFRRASQESTVERITLQLPWPIEACLLCSFLRLHFAWAAGKPVVSSRNTLWGWSWGILPTPTNFGSLRARRQALQLWKNARVSLSSLLACYIPTLIVWYFVSHGLNRLKKNNFSTIHPVQLPYQLACFPDMFSIHPHPSPVLSSIRECQ